MVRVLRLLAGPEAALFCLAVLPYAYFYHPGGGTPDARFELVRGLVEKRTVRPQDQRGRGKPGDPACPDAPGGCGGETGNRARTAAVSDSFHCGQAPGASWLATPPYAVAWVAGGGDAAGPRFFTAAFYASTLIAIAAPAALGVVMLSVLLACVGIGQLARVAVSLAYGLGTLAFPLATVFAGDQLAAALLITAFALLVAARLPERPPPRTGRLVAVGALLGFAIAADYAALWAAVAIALYAAFWMRPRRLVWVGAGAAVPGTLLALYHWRAFADPLAFSCQFLLAQARELGSGPNPDVLFAILFSGGRGLFAAAPWLLLAVPGAVRLLRRRAYRGEAIVCIAVAIAALGRNASAVDWDGGSGLGPQYLTTALPFLAVLAGGCALPHCAVPAPHTAVAQSALWRALVIAGWTVFSAAAAYSIALMLATTSVQPRVPADIEYPFGDLIWPRFAAGDLAPDLWATDDRITPDPARDGPPEPGAWNLGHLMGLGGLVSLLPLAAAEWLALLWLLAAARNANMTRSKGAGKQRTGL